MKVLKSVNGIGIVLVDVLHMEHTLPGHVIVLCGRRKGPGALRFARGHAALARRRHTSNTKTHELSRVIDCAHVDTV